MLTSLGCAGGLGWALSWPELGWNCHLVNPEPFTRAQALVPKPDPEASNCGNPVDLPCARPLVEARAARLLEAPG